MTPVSGDRICKAIGGHKLREFVVISAVDDRGEFIVETTGAEAHGPLIKVHTFLRPQNFVSTPSRIIHAEQWSVVETSASGKVVSFVDRLSQKEPTVA